MDKKKLEKIEEVAQRVEKEGGDTIVDILLDENNRDPISLVDGNGRRLTFEQIAVIPYKEKLYCVLKPVDKLENIQDDEAIVFYVEEKEGEEPVLMVETDEKVAMDVFDEYYNLLDEAEGKKEDKKPSKK